MKRITFIYIIAGIALTAGTLPAGAQTPKQANDSTLNRTVVVEQEYNPDIEDANKMNVLPRVEEPTVSKKAVEYDETLVPATRVPATTMEAYTVSEPRPKARPGYARLGYGNNGNLDARAFYRFDLSDSDRLNVGFRMNGMNGNLDYEGIEGGWDAFFYHSNAGIDYRHSFRRATLDVAGDFDLKNFNLLQGKQKFTTGGLHIGSASTSDEFPVQYRVETNVRLYSRQHDLFIPDAAARETRVRTKADVWGAIDEKQQVGIAAEMNNLFYNHDFLENYTALTLNPYYRFTPGNWQIRLGVNVDFSFGFGKSFRISPDVAAQLTFADSHIFYVNATGGKQLNSFQRLGEVNPYLQLSGLPDATYELVNANIGYKASPVIGLWLNIFGGYQNLQNELFLTGSPSITGASYLRPVAYLDDVYNVHAGLEISYDYRSLFTIDASGVYRHWSGSGMGHEAKPAFVGDIRADIHPISPLEVTVGFRYASDVKDNAVSLDEYTNLYVRGSYEFIPGIAIYVQAENLTNADNLQRYFGYPTQGVHFLGGVSFRF